MPQILNHYFYTRDLWTLRKQQNVGYTDATIGCSLKQPKTTDKSSSFWTILLTTAKWADIHWTFFSPVDLVPATDPWEFNGLCFGRACSLPCSTYYAYAF